MSNTLNAFLLTLLAGLSTMIGTVLIFLKKDKHNNLVCKSLSFAAGVMITVSLTDLIPEGQHLLLDTFFPIPAILISLIFLIIGFIISNLINTNISNKNNIKYKSNLYRVGIVSMIAIILHNIPEGIATFMTSSHNISLGISLTIAIALHNIPEGISISVPIFYASNSRKKALFYTFISGISELFGAIIAYLFLKPIINSTFMGILYLIIAGIMINISFKELLPSSFDYKKTKSTILYFLIGVGVMIINYLYF